MGSSFPGYLSSGLGTADSSTDSDGSEREGGMLGSVFQSLER